MDELLTHARAVLDTVTATEIAKVYGDDVVFPEQVVISRFPGWSGDVLVLATENQGVCRVGPQHRCRVSRSRRGRRWSR